MEQAFMEKELRILMLEDTPSDAELIEHELRGAGIVFTSKRVDTRADFVRELEDFLPDIILSDYNLPDFDGLSALKIVCRDHPEVPVVMVTGVLSDFDAVELIHAGAKDYVLKDRLARLAPAVKRAIATEQNIRARKLAEKALRESEAKFRALVESTSDWIWEIDERAVYTYSSPQVYDLLGYTAEEIIGKTPFDLMPPDEAVRVTAVFGSLLQERKPFRLLGNANLHKDGRTLFLETSGVPILDAQGVFMGYRGIDRDITERKQLEASVLNEKTLLRTLIDAIPDLIFFKNKKSVYLGCNKAFEEFFGAAEKTIIGKTDFDFVDAEMAKFFRMKDKEMMAAGHTVKNEEWVTYPDGHKACLETLKTPYVTPQGDALGILGISRDITERKQADDERRLSAEKLELVLSQTIVVIAATVEARDPYTSGHQRRVATLATAIAHEMGFPPDKIHGLYLAATIHDLGKIHLPAEILSKPGRLKPIEFELIKSHPQAGYDIVKDVQFTWSIAQMVLQHHERLDGSGYPQGLKSEQILPEAKILAVADVVEAMSSHRPYRASLGIDAALEEISAHRGVWFDPAVVDCCITLFREKGFAFE